ncbi:MAG: hypothetical protein HDR24_02035 [Lachnospiraceae bacterium]|nr:hypothetical protein [Lachnospiraceae bacterium]
MKTGYYKKAAAIISGILVFVALGFFLKLYIIGEPVDNAQVYCSTVVDGQNLELRIESVESAIAFRGWKIEQEGNTLSITARKVLVSPLFDGGSYETTIDLEAIENVWFGGQLIWSKSD